MAHQVAERQLSVRQTESLVRQLLKGGEASKRAATASAKDPDTRRLEREMTERVGAPVTINHNDQGRGQLVIRYSSLAELDGILRHLKP